MRLFSIFSNDIGIDLGTATTLVYVRGRGIVLFEPSVVAIRAGTSEVLAVGSEAKEMLGRTPANIVAMRPMRDGVIANFSVTEEMLKYFIHKAHGRRRFVAPRVVVCVPTGITEVERNAVRQASEMAGASETFLLEEPMAAAIGAGLPVQEPLGHMIVDIGGGTTEVAVISLGGIVTGNSIRVAGDEMDLAIQRYMRESLGLIVGERTAEEIKVKMGSAFPREQETTMEVRGRSAVDGLPRTVTVRSEEIREALAEPVSQVVQAVVDTLERTPPELAADLVDNGIVLAGGGSLLEGLDKRISEATGMRVRRSPEPMNGVALGAGKVLEELDVLSVVVRE